MTQVYKTLKVNSNIAMSFIGRTFARLRYIQKKTKQRIDAVQLVIKDAMVAIYLDGRLLLEATKESVASGQWNINMSFQLRNLLDSQAVLV